MCNPHNVEHTVERKEAKLCKLEVPQVRDVDHHPGKVADRVRLDQDGPGGGRDGGRDRLG